MLLLPLLTAALADCPEPPLPIQESVDAALAATQAADFDGLLVHVAVLDARLACTQALVDPELVPELHLLHGLEAAYALPPRDLHVVAAFRGLAAADPDNDRVEALTPSGHPLRALYEEAAAAAGYAETERLPEGSWAVDGRIGVASVPLGRASVLQKLDGDEVVGTWYLWGEGAPEALVPPEPVVMTPVITEPSLPPPPELSPRAPRLLAAGAGAALALGAASYGLAHRSYAAWEADDATDPQAAYTRWNTPNQAALVGAALGGVAGVGLGVGALVSWRW